MSCVDKLLTRRSIRKYKADPIPKEIMENILEAGRQSPSAINKQPWHFIVVTDQKLKDKLGGGLFNRMLKNSAFAIVGCYMPGNIFTNKYAPTDTAIAMQSMVLAAHLQGIGSCWLGDYNENNVRKLFKIPDNVKILAVIAFGYPDEEPKLKKKKKTEEIMHYNKW